MEEEYGITLKKLFLVFKELVPNDVVSVTMTLN